MSNKYKHGDRVPSDVLCNRLDELAKAVTQGKDAVIREFSMRVPAELDHDADLVLSAASKRIAKLEERDSNQANDSICMPDIEVTEEMQQAGRQALLDNEHTQDWKDTAEAVFKAMIASQQGSIATQVEKEGLSFGDYITVEQKRYGADNEMYQYKVIGTLKSNFYASVPVTWTGDRKGRSVAQKDIVPVVQCICCGVDESMVVRFRIQDVRLIIKPDNRDSGNTSVMVDREDLKAILGMAEYAPLGMGNDVGDRLEALLSNEGDG